MSDIIKIDLAACLKGGEMAGQYLDEIGKTDLADLNEGQWALFCQKLVAFTILAATQAIPCNETPPF